MRIETRNALLKALQKFESRIADEKGKAYSGDTDANSNFKRNADRLGLTKYQIWGVYFNKHIDSINNAIKADPETPNDETEGLFGRIVDARNYLGILCSMLVEDGLIDALEIVDEPLAELPIQ